MAPLPSGVRLKAFKENPNPRLSAVMVLLWQQESEIFTSLMKRPEYNGTHSAQISFPGGKKEDEDTNLIETALRETHEEVGIEGIDIVGKLSEVYIPPSGFLVSPYIGSIQQPPSFVPDPVEVDQIIEIPLRFFLNEKSLETRQISTRSGNLHVPCFVYNDHIIWGATAMMLNELRNVIGIGTNFWSVNS